MSGQTQQDLLIQNARIVDGTGAPAFSGNVLVRGKRIAAVGPGVGAPGARVLDAGGRVLAPGFIDLHRHCDFRALAPGFGRAELAQGVTTALSGVCGMSAFPQVPARRREYEEYLLPCLGRNPAGTAFGGLPAYHALLERAALPLNLGTFVGAGAVKVFARGFADGPFTAGQLDAAAGQVAAALAAGAFGLSLGIMYTPECYSSAAEMARLAAPVRDRGLVCAHIRGEGDTLVPSVREVIDIARRAEVPLQISHFKAFGVHNWHDTIFRAIEVIEGARAAGQDVTVDFYPYCAGSTILFSIIPPQFLQQGQAQALRLLATAEGKRRLRRALYTEVPGWDSAVLQLGLERIVISSVQKAEHLPFVGKSIAENCRALGVAEPADWIADLLAAEDGQVGVLVNSMAQEDVDTVARLPYSTLISDSLYCATGLPHPRLYGSFPRFLQEYCVRRPMLGLEEAIAKMTSLPARRAGLAGRGEIKPGHWADLVLFDPARFADKATFDAPAQLAAGMDLVLVNGAAAWQNGAPGPSPSGRVLKRNAL